MAAANITVGSKVFVRAQFGNVTRWHPSIVVDGTGTGLAVAVQITREVHCLDTGGRLT